MSADEPEYIDVVMPTEEELDDFRRRVRELRARSAAIPQDQRVLLNSPEFATPIGADNDGNITVYEPRPRPDTDG